MSIYGHDSRGSVGKQMVLFSSTTDMQGRKVPCPRLRVPA